MLKLLKILDRVRKKNDKSDKECASCCEKRVCSALHASVAFWRDGAPTPLGVLYGCEKKGVAEKGICNAMKTKGGWNNDLTRAA